MIWIVLFASLLVGCITIYFDKTWTSRIFLLCMWTAVFLYDGLAVGMYPELHAYVWEYLVFLIVLLLSFELANYLAVFFRLRSAMRSTADSVSYSFQDFLVENRRLMKYGAYFYIGMKLVLLLYPTFRLDLLLHPPNLTLVGHLDDLAESRTDSLYRLVTMLQMFFLPFLYIHCMHLLGEGKKIKSIILMILPVYISFVDASYISRNELITLGLTLLAMLTAYEKESQSFKISLRFVLTVGVLLLFCIPLLSAFETYRLNGELSIASLSDSVDHILTSETGIARYIPFADAYGRSDVVSGIDYILWLIFLPVPSALWPGKPTLGINTIFSSLILGVGPGQPGYYVLLPTVLGDSLLVWGPVFYWMTALLVGSIAGIVIGRIKTIPSLRLYALYYSGAALVFARGGSQSILGTMVNGSISLILLFVVFQMVRKVRSASRIEVEKAANVAP